MSKFRKLRQNFNKIPMKKKKTQIKIINWFIFPRKIQSFYSLVSFFIIFIIIFDSNVLFPFSFKSKRKYITNTHISFQSIFDFGIYGRRDKRDDDIILFSSLVKRKVLIKVQPNIIKSKDYWLKVLK